MDEFLIEVNIHTCVSKDCFECCLWYAKLKTCIVRSKCRQYFVEHSKEHKRTVHKLLLTNVSNQWHDIASEKWYILHSIKPKNKTRIRYLQYGPRKMRLIRYLLYF